VFTSVAAGEFSTCALATGGGAYCWGQIADPDASDAARRDAGVPEPVESSPALVSLASGYYHVCGLTASGAAFCWGSGFAGQLGDGTVTSFRDAPAEAAGSARFVSLSGGYWHTCAVTSEGEGYCWGNNNWAQLGDSTRAARSAPAPVPLNVVFSKISAGGRHTCGLTTSGDAYCWGWNAFGQLGDGSTAIRLTAVPVRAGTLVFSNIVAGWYHTCALASGGAAYCWGFNSRGQLGNGSTTDSSSPTPVGGGLLFTELSLGVSHTCGVTKTGTTYCWGENTFGQLGDGTTTDATLPRLVSRLP
jgi:alpha-tubulin suppressor-like RCC1 family protein